MNPKKARFVSDIITAANMFKTLYSTLDALNEVNAQEGYATDGGANEVTSADLQANPGSEHLTEVEFRAALAALDTLRGNINTQKAAIFSAANSSSF